MFAIGEKYLLDSLQQHAAHRLSHHILHSRSKDSFAEAMVSAIHQAYITCLDPKNIICSALVDYAATYHEQFSDGVWTEKKNAPTREAATNTPQFTTEVLGQVISIGGMSSYDSFRCLNDECNAEDLRMWVSQRQGSPNNEIAPTCGSRGETNRARLMDFDAKMLEVEADPLDRA